jgi:hypothetical protein
VQIPILSGIYADTAPDLRTALPVNMMAVPKVSGVSNGYLRPGDGVVEIGTGPGVCRGGIVWNGGVYRVMGTKLCLFDAGGAATVLGDVGTGGQCKFDYSFDRLAITSGGRLYYWDGSLQQVTDPDLGVAETVVWIDGYFMTTDGEFLVVTELNDPFAVNPLKYGSSEIDPDPVLTLLKLRNEIYAVNRNTIEVFDNVGGELFPFARNEGAQIQKGAIGRDACCVYLDTIAFVGSSRNEAPAIYMARNGSAPKISTQEIDTLLSRYTEAELAGVLLETRNDRNHQLLYVHLPDRTLVYDAAATEAVQEPVWVELSSALVGYGQYRARNILWAYDAWQACDTATGKVGNLTRTVGTHWGERVRWEFATSIIYNEGAGAIVSRLELVALTGSVAPGGDPTISTSYTVDGVTWSQPRYVRAGSIGERAKRLCWFRQGNMRHWRVQRFQGTSDAHIAVVRLEAQLEPLAW